MNEIKLLDENLNLTLDVSKQLAKYENQIKKIENLREEYIEAIKLAMENNNIEMFDNDFVHINYIAPTVRATLDQKKLKEEDLETYSKYLKTTDVKSSVRIKVKEN